MLDDIFHASRNLFTILDHIDEGVAGNTFIDNEKIDIGGGILLKHRDGFERHVDSVFLIFAMNLFEKISSHSNPPNFRSR